MSLPTQILQPDPGFDINANRGSNVVAASVVLLVLPTLAVALRLVSRWTSRAALWWDDYMIIVAMVLAWGPNISNLVSVHQGLGRHFAALSHPPDMFAPLRQFFKNLYAFVMLYTLAMTATKFSIIFFMHRIFPIVHFRRFLMACHLFVGLLGFSAFVVEIFPCTPVHDYWDGLAGRLQGKCIDVIKFFLAGASLNAAFNFVLLVLPIPLLWRLRTSVLQKVVLTVIFILGLTVCAVGLTHIIVLNNLDEDDLPWNYVNAAIWTAAEPSIAVVCACLPSFRPLLARLIWGRSYRPAHVPHSSQQSFSKSWLSASRDAENSPSRGFNRLRESEGSFPGLQKTWMHNVAVTGGESPDEYPMSEGGRMGHLPDGIRVQTVITVTQRVDYQDDLF